MRNHRDLGELAWTLAGWTPYVWRQQTSIESGASLNAEIPQIEAHVPGSVQGALRDAGVIPDWNVGLQGREAEWVENRHWIYTCTLPAAWTDAPAVRLRALGLDYAGWVLLNGREVGTFRGTFVPCLFDLTPHLRDGDNVLQIVFDTPPRWLGQIGYTSEMREWKERFNYFWDWTGRLVQIGIWDDLLLETGDGQWIEQLSCSTDADSSGRGTLELQADICGEQGARVRVALERDGREIRAETLDVHGGRAQCAWRDLPVDLWWPNGYGDQPLYTLCCALVDAYGNELDRRETRVGFKHTEWEPCQDAPPEADPWLCVVNGTPVFLQGVNWTPILPNFADVPDSHYRHLLETYQQMGCTILRVWGGAFLEKQVFYDLCDELGLLVWQEFPLSSSGLDNNAPSDPDSIAALVDIATSYIERRRHHVSLLLWCGGNELQGPRHDGVRGEQPLDFSHPTIRALCDVVTRLDPGRRFLPTSSSGPSFGGDASRFGQGVHWDVHGPWHIEGDLETTYREYWERDDSLFRSEVGVAGASPVEIIRDTKGDLSETPGTRENPLWRRSSWWIDWPAFVREQGREPESLEEFVDWSQSRQARAIGIAARACKARFPRCGGFIVWMGHDSFPCTANTAVIDFRGHSKPAAEELKQVFTQQA